MPGSRCSSGIVPFSKNSSMSASLPSAMISTIFSCRPWRRLQVLAGIGISRPLPFPPMSYSVGLHADEVDDTLEVLFACRSATGPESRRVRRPRCTECSMRSTSARSRSMRPPMNTRGISYSSAYCHAFSVETSTPETPSTTVITASTTGMAILASCTNMLKPGVSMKLIFACSSTRRTRASCDGHAAGNFFFVVIGGGGAIVDLTQLRGRARGIEHGRRPARSCPRPRAPPGLHSGRLYLRRLSRVHLDSRRNLGAGTHRECVRAMVSPTTPHPSDPKSGLARGPYSEPAGSEPWLE